MCKGLDTQNVMRIRDDIAANSHRVRLTHCTRICIKNCMALTHTMKTLCMYVGKQLTHCVHTKACVCTKTVFVPKNHLCRQFTQLLNF